MGAMVGLLVIACAAALGEPATQPTLSPSDPAATRVSLHLAGVPRTSAFAALAAASGMGNPVGTPGRNEPLITVDAENQPYWNVLLWILDQSKGVDFSSPSIGLPLANTPSDALAGLRSIDGAFVLSLNQRNRSVSFTGPAAPSREASLSGFIAFEPRLNVLYLDRNIAPSAALDENGLSLLPSHVDSQPPRAFNGDNSLPIGVFPGSIAMPMTINLNLPRTVGKRIARLSITMHAWVAEEMATIRFPYGHDATDNTDPAACSAKWTASEDNPRLEIKFAAGSIKPAVWVNRAAFLSVSRVALMDSSGVAWRSDSNRNDGDYQDNGITFAHTFTRPDPAKGATVPTTKPTPTEATVEFPTVVKAIELHFNFENIPLP
jgi:hypothetical protein